jgi:hypothetical protein
MSFLEDLQNRRDRARDRVESLRLALAEAEKEFESWTAAVFLEERTQTQTPSPLVFGDNSGTLIMAPQHDLDVQNISFSPEEVRSKRGVLLGYFRSVNRALQARELEKLVKPAMSRASLYSMLRVLETEGIIGRDDKRRYVLKKTDEKEAPMKEAS